MIIRRESPKDVAAIRAVTAAAFATAEHSAPPVEPDGAPGEATLVGWLREDAGWIPELSLVAEDDGPRRRPRRVHPRLASRGGRRWAWARSASTPTTRAQAWARP